METGPGPIVEALVAAVLPAERREDVLGDLHQRYSSRFGYWKDVFGVVPFVVVSHLRRESVRRTDQLLRRTIKGWSATQSIAVVGLVSAVETLSLLAWLAVRGHRWSLLGAMVSSWAATVWHDSASAEPLAPNATAPVKRSDTGE